MEFWPGRGWSKMSTIYCVLESYLDTYNIYIVTQLLFKILIENEISVIPVFNKCELFHSTANLRQKMRMGGKGAIYK